MMNVPESIGVSANYGPQPKRANFPKDASFKSMKPMEARVEAAKKNDAVHL
jgi:hypothetical protein